jgi:hypothetical protein
VLEAWTPRPFTPILGETNMTPQITTALRAFIDVVKGIERQS